MEGNKLMFEDYERREIIFPFSKKNKRIGILHEFEEEHDAFPHINRIGFDDFEYSIDYFNKRRSSILSESTFRKIEIEKTDNNTTKRNNDINIYQPCIIDSYGEVINKDKTTPKIIVSEINDQLLYTLSKNPNLLYSLTPYNFECVVARIFEKNGYSVKITPRTHDEGKDIFVAKNDLFSFLFYIECKKYSPNHHVGIDIIQRLYGVVSAEKATGGIVATTSYFTQPAKDYIEKHQLNHQLTLHDYNDIINNLKSLRYDTQ